MKYLSYISFLCAINLTQVDASAPRYVTSAIYKKFCPLGYREITDKNACESASEFLGIKYDASKNGDQDTAVCIASYMSTDTKKPSSWSTGQVSAAYYSKAAYICELSDDDTPNFVKQEIAVDSCPEGYGVITSDSVCEIAARFLGYNYDASKNGDSYSSNDAVCFISYLDWYSEKPKSWSKVQVNSNHWDTDAYICKKTGASVPAELQPKNRVQEGSTSASQYVISVLYKKFCPLGYREITDTSVCESASKSLGIKYDASKFGDASATYDQVCFATYIDKYTQKPSQWSTGQVNSNHWGKDAYICELSNEVQPFIKQLMGVDSCPEGYNTITHVGLCARAAQYFSYTYDASKNGEASSDAVCYVSGLEWYAEKPKYDSTVQVNSKHYENAAYLCRRRVQRIRVETPKTSAPIRSPTGTPNKPPTKAPIKPPTKPPAKAPVNAPMESAAQTAPTFVVQKRNVDSCPLGYSAIIDVNGCEAAAKSLGIFFDITMDGDDYYDDVTYVAESVCFASYVDDDGNLNKLEYPSIAMVNSQHYTFAGWICKNDSPTPTESQKTAPNEPQKEQTVAKTASPTNEPTKSPTRAPTKSPTGAQIQPDDDSVVEAETGPPYVVQMRNVDSCPSGYSMIEQVDSCAAAATFLGIEYDEELSGEDGYYDDDFYKTTCFASYIDDHGNVNTMEYPSVARVAANHYTYAGWVCKRDSSARTSAQARPTEPVTGGNPVSSPVESPVESPVNPAPVNDAVPVVEDNIFVTW
eukprot:CAMPEP_0194274326 /NCGR_PEP_ID=MMETSP0169-20130528/7424_1 /TAXON_ID=218684 /ORGANISM="Corethron pennatum, Strain L29A3" /LENGTH=754 /DNA_ID=CAMNT_0039017483 /DNA_START=102 /DNA_END=2363 /DNA_ORIENTATION=-